MAKILHISKYYYPYYGGIEDVAQTIVDELKPFHTQRVICFNSRRCNEKTQVNGVLVTRVLSVGTFASQPLSINYRRKLKQVIDEFKPDYIHLHLPNPLVSFFLLRTDLHNAKLVIHWHSDILDHNLTYFVYKNTERKILAKSDKIITTSETYCLSSKQLKPFAYKTMILPNTVNGSKFLLQNEDNQQITDIKKKYGNKKILFFIGRHVPYKGIDLLIDAEKYIDTDCVIVIAGSGILTSALRAKAKNSNKIAFIGRISDEVLKLHLYASDIFVFPSYTRSEAFGVALAEALYCGLPAVSFNIEGSGTTWVNKDNYSGYVVDNMNVKAFALAVNKLLKDDDLRQKMGKNAKLWIRDNFLQDRIVPILDNIYKPDNQNVVAENKINISIVLYNNSFEKVRDLVNSLKQNNNAGTIYLIDNSKMMQQEFMQLPVCYIFNGKNIGYGRGHNIALKQTLCADNAAYHLVMNADVNFDPYILTEIADYMQQHQDVGVLMPKVFYPNGNIQYLCRLLPTPIDLIVRRFLPKAVMKKRVARLELRNTDYNRILNIPHISGCFMFLRTNILSEVGLFDERYFLYLEDVDLTRRILKQAKTIFYPQVSIIHEHRQGSYSSMKLLLVHIVSAIRYFNKWGWINDSERNWINKQILKQLQIKSNEK
ncbi:MAG: glycosyltransferase [Prevotellaceae bacterium]|nr:glycosyltransferase [Prevotellaceae bacterium]